MIQNWDNKVVELFSCFADVDFQRRSWFGLGPEVSSSAEMCNWIEDIALEEWLSSNNSKLGPHLEKYIGNFLESVNSLPETPDDWVAFSSPEWAILRLKAAVIRDLLKKGGIA